MRLRLEGSIDEKVIERFWTFVPKREPDTCWEWIGSGAPSATPGKVYDHMNVARKNLRAPRISWFIHHGVDPGPLDVLHNCPGGDNPACVNPAHLWLGTMGENSRDMVAKGRGKIPHKSGENHNMALINWDTAREIRRLYPTGNYSQRKLAKMLGTTQFVVWGVVNNMYWYPDPLDQQQGV